MTFEEWKNTFLMRAASDGFSSEFLEQISPHITHLSAPAAADTTQPEARKTLHQYLQVAVSDARIKNGQTALAAHKHTFNKIEATYGVDRHVVAAIWGMETNYGQIRGDLNVLSALASLAFAGRRRTLFETQLLAALKIVQRRIIPATDMMGSWAGAMGHTQFMPTSYLDFAVSLDRGVPNIWGDDPGDALASTAHYLTCHGWIADQPWGAEVSYDKAANLHDLRYQKVGPPDVWQGQGVVAKTTKLPDGDYTFILPGGIAAPAFLVGANYQALLAYNNAAAYAVGVGHLADRLAGHAPFTHNWDGDARGMTQAETAELQTRLTNLGFDSQGADGFVGPNTTYAIDAFQAEHDYPIDGFPTLGLLEILREPPSSSG